MDVFTLVLGPVYRIHGVPASLTLADGTAVPLRVIDQTAGALIDVGDGEMSTAAPAVRVPRSSLPPGSVARAVLSVGGAEYRVMRRVPVYSRSGGATGEVTLLLEELPDGPP